MICSVLNGWRCPQTCAPLPSHHTGKISFSHLLSIHLALLTLLRLELLTASPLSSSPASHLPVTRCPLPHPPTPPPAPPPSSNCGSPSNCHFIVSPGTDFSLSLDHFLAGYSCIFCLPISLSLSLPRLSLSLSFGQTAEGGSPRAATNYSFPSIPSPCCQKRLQKRQIRRLKNTFCFLLSRCSNFITSQQILGKTY